MGFNYLEHINNCYTIGLLCKHDIKIIINNDIYGTYYCPVYEKFFDGNYIPDINCKYFVEKEHDWQWSFFWK